MAIKTFTTEALYEAAGLPTDESRVALVEDIDDVKIDGVNVRTTNPTVGDACFHDGTSVFYLKGGDQLVKSLLPSNWTFIGAVFGRQGDKVGVLNKEQSSQNYLDVCQYTISAIASTSITLNLRMSPNYGVNTPVSITLSSTDINATTAEEISTAVAAKATEVGDTKDWWAYLADDDGNKVDEGGTKIIVQCDTCVDYRVFIVSATGCTISHTTWGDMPACNYYLKDNGKTTNYLGLMNLSRGLAYWSNSGRTPTAAETIPVSGNTDPVKKEQFENSDYCTALREAYATYEDYLRGECLVKFPQKAGTFAMPDGKTLTLKYGLASAPTKSGGTKYKYPAMNYAYNTTYGLDGVDFGDWYMPGVCEGMQFMSDEPMAKIQATFSKMGAAALNNSTYRWFAQRFNVYLAWNFNGAYGYLHSYYVCYINSVRAVSLLPLA